jgi:sugar O-acyltransferase (sialic acid O-acetyltransferase NeuD family)
MPNKIVVYGNGQYARLIHQMVQDDGLLEIAAFAADEQFVTGRTFLGLDVVPFERVETIYPPEGFDMLVAIGAVRVRDRKRMFEKAKAKGYRLANYVAPQANTYSDLVLGENNIIFRGAYLGPGGCLGDNNMIRPNCYVGHDFRIGSHNYLAPGCNLGGFSRIADLCYIGIGATMIQGLSLADETLIGAGSLVLRSTEPRSKYYGSPARKMGEHADTGIVMRPAEPPEDPSTAEGQGSRPE